jgi:hypothetical protein
MGIFNRGSDRANDSARRPAVPMNMSSNGAPPALGERRSTLSDVPSRPMSNGVMSPSDIASEKQKGWASFQQKEYGGVQNRLKDASPSAQGGLLNKVIRNM